MALRAVLNLDMVGFTKTMEEGGVDAARARVDRTRATCREVFGKHAGRVVWTFADNVIATFPSVPQAVSAAYDVLSALKGAGSIGIGWGEVDVDEEGAWGLEVNRASRLGEDTAGTGEVLLTDAAQAALKAAQA